MLIRTYRVSDKLGFVLLKLSAAAGDWLLLAAHQVVTGLARIVPGLVAALGWLLGAVAAGLRLMVSGLRRLWSVVMALLRLLLAIVRFVGRRTGWAAGQVARSGARGGVLLRSASSSHQTVEDPLRVENRRLSVLVAVMGLALVGVLLWATDPARQVASPPRASGLDGRLALMAALTPQASEDLVVVGGGLPTPVPTATDIPAALQPRGTIAFTARERGQQDIWALGIGARAPIRLVASPVDDRDPAWSPDGSRLAYASRQDGNWELYVYDLSDRSTTRMTYDLSFQGHPRWSPDGLWLVYESYQGDNLDIYAMPVDGSETPIRITDDPAPDFAPAWSPDGREIAFVSWRADSQDIFVFNLDSLDVRNVTQSPLRDEDEPAISPDGDYLAYSARDQGADKVFVQALHDDTPADVISFGRTPAWSPDGASLAFMVDAGDGQMAYLYAYPYRDEGVATEVVDVLAGSDTPTWSSRVLPPALVNAGGLELSAQPLFMEQASEYDGDPPYRLNALLDVEAPNPVLNDRVNDSFNALREAVLDAAGWDFLGQLDHAFWEIDRLPQPGEERRNWHMSGRAFSFTRSAILGFPPAIELVREDVGIHTYWRIYLRTADDAQSGELGEPLRHAPWDLLSRGQGDVEAYNQGGRLRADIPAGYYIDLTQLAADYGWRWTPAGSDWRANTNSINYWSFVRDDGLSWYQAMREIYTDAQLGAFAATPSAASALSEPVDAESGAS